MRRETRILRTFGRGQFWLYIASIPLVLYCLFSLYFMSYVFLNSFKTRSEFFGNLLGLPQKWVTENISKAWVDGNFERYFINSVLVTGLSLVAILFLSALTAYGLARFRFKRSNMLYMYFIAGLMFPANMYIVPLYLLMRDLHLTNTIPGLVLVYTTIGLSFGVFILTGFFRTLPEELAEAAKMDGAGHFRIFAGIMLPIARPALATVSIFIGIGFWNEFFMALIFIQNNNLKTLPIGIQTFVGKYQSDYVLIFSALLITMIPLLLMYIIGSKNMIKGLTAGALK